MKPMIRFTVAMALLVACAAQAQPQAPQSQTPVTLQGAGPFHRLTLPIALYSHAAFDDLRDVRVRNAGGRAVPFAWLDDQREAPTLQTASLHAPLFAMPVLSTSAPASTNAIGAGGDELMVFKVRPDGSLALGTVPVPGKDKPAAPGPVAEWVIDASQVSGSLVQLRFELAPGAQGVFAFTLEGSDDMRQWRRIADGEQLVRLQHGDQTIERLALELDHARARFMRLRWHDPRNAPVLAGVWLDSVQELAAPISAIVWSPEVRAASCGNDYCDYPVPRGLPVQGLRIALSEANTLAPLRISSLLPSSGSPARSTRLRPHNALYALRYGRPPDERDAGSTSASQELTLADTTVYRLNQPGGEVRSASVPMDGDAHVTLRLRTQGPISALGAPPTLSFGARPRALVFLAQGNPPFTLSWNATRQSPVDASGPLPLAQLLPGFQPKTSLPADGASVSLMTMPVTAVMPAVEPSAATARHTTTAEATVPTRKLWLWAALGAGLLLLSGMAWSLLRGLKNEPPT